MAQIDRIAQPADPFAACVEQGILLFATLRRRGHPFLTRSDGGTGLATAYFLTAPQAETPQWVPRT